MFSNEWTLKYLEVIKGVLKLLVQNAVHYSISSAISILGILGLGILALVILGLSILGLWYFALPPTMISKFTRSSIKHFLLYEHKWLVIFVIWKWT